MSTYELVEMGKRAKGIDSDRGYALSVGLTAQNVQDWKTRRVLLPSVVALRKLCDAAGVTMETGLKICLDEHNAQQELALGQRGFANVFLLSGISVVSLALATHMPYEVIAAGLLGANAVYYVKSRYRFMRRKCSAGLRNFRNALPHFDYVN